MDHRDHVGLLAPGLAGEPRGAGVRWADIGAGSGAFTLALADLLGPGATIVAVDRDRRALDENRRAVEARFPGVVLKTLVADLTGPLDLAPLDGIVAANSLHFVGPVDQVATVRRLAGLLRPGGPFLLVEYDSDQGNQWVPHPFTPAGWERIAAAAGLVDVAPIGHVPSRWLGGIYSAAARRPPGPATAGGRRRGSAR